MTRRFTEWWLTAGFLLMHSGAAALKTVQQPVFGAAPSPAFAVPPGLAAAGEPFQQAVAAVATVLNFALPVGPGNVAKPFSLAECEVELTGPICMGDEEHGREVRLPMALAAGLRGFWSFDQNSVLDATSYRNHAFGRLAVGPAQGGQGSSAFFRRSFLEVTDAQGTLQLKDFSYTFWVYLIDDPTSKGLKLCPLVRKGLGGSVPIGDLGRQSDASPAVLFDRFSQRLRVEFVTSGAPDLDPSLTLAEAFESNARLRTGRWYHISVLRWDNARTTHLYVNGVLDSSHITKGFLRPMREPIFVGGDPLTAESCDLPMYIDELKVYDRPLDVDEIQAEAAPALMGIEPAFVRLACVNCPLELASRSCTEGYHVCSSIEMHMGGYQVAHSLGWLSPGGRAWNRQNVVAQVASAPAPAAAAVVSELELPANGRLLQTAATLAGGASDPVVAAAAEAGVPELGLGLCCADD